MKAIPRQQLLLLDLQQLDHNAARLRRKGAQLPEQQTFNELGAEREAFRDSYMEAQRELDARRLELSRIESDVAVVVQREHRDRELIAQSTAAKEAQSLQTELDMLANRKAELEERQFEAMEIADAAEEKFAAAEAVLQGLEDRRAVLAAAIATATAEIDAEFARTAEERANVAAEVQGDLLALYEDIRVRNGIGAARLNGNVSEASGMALTASEISAINEIAPDQIVFCPGTGAILVRGASD